MKIGIDSIELDNIKFINHIHTSECVKNFSHLILNSLLSLKVKNQLQRIFDIPMNDIQQFDMFLSGSIEDLKKIKNSIVFSKNEENSQFISGLISSLISGMQDYSSFKNKDHLKLLLKTSENLYDFWDKSFTDYINSAKTESLGDYYRNFLLDYLNIDTIFDIGANVGQYAEKIFSIGYKNQIHSFEPVSINFEALKRIKNATSYHWSLHQTAIGSKDERLNINIASNSACSSFNENIQKEMLSMGFKVNQETVQVTSLDDYIRVHNLDFKNSYIKIDVENFEKEVLLGAKDTLDKALAVEVEARFIYYAKDQWLIGDIISYLHQFEFVPFQFYEPVKDISTAIWYGCDLIFIKKSIAKELNDLFNSIYNNNRNTLRCDSPGCRTQSII